MPGRARAASKAKPPAAPNGVDTTASEAGPLPKADTQTANGKKRTAPRPKSPEAQEDSTSQQSSDLTEDEADSQPSQTSSRKRARTTKTAPLAEPKPVKEKPPPTRVSKRKATKASSKESQAKLTKGAKGGEPGGAKPAPKARVARQPKVLPPPVNPLPGIPTHLRPPLNIFCQGTGDFGQLGLGVDVLGPVKRPRLHAWFKEAIETGKLGGEDAGVEFVAVGGMHNLVVDEAGRVWSWGIVSTSPKIRQYWPLSSHYPPQLCVERWCCFGPHNS